MNTLIKMENSNNNSNISMLHDTNKENKGILLIIIKRYLFEFIQRNIRLA
jgi:hypothetical protein